MILTAEKTRRILTIENARIYGGFGSAVAETLSRLRPTHVEMMGIGDEEVESAPLADLLRHYHLTPADMTERALQMCSEQGKADGKS